MEELRTTWVGVTAKQIARAVRRGDTTATQVVADHLEQIAISEPQLNAFRVVRGGEAIVEAEKVDEQEDLANLPLAGVPIAVKENTAVAGLPTWNGSAAARTPIAEEDHEVVRRLRGAGAVILGVTRMPELGLWALTDDETAVTRNPWHVDRTPGGSSGGAAAAVAAGLVPIAHGNDGLGSIRIPAACCGLVGLKPGRGVLPWDLGVNDWFGLTEHGLLTTTVAGAALGFGVLAGRTPARLGEPGRRRVSVSWRFPGAGAAAALAFTVLAGRPPARLVETGRLRPGVRWRSPVAGVRPAEPNRGGFTTAAKLLAGAGHYTPPAEPTYPTMVGLGGLATWF